ncbi:MAG TPA: hypothetical protein VF365_07445 [Candidatus Limnocylindria bacterium]
MSSTDLATVERAVALRDLEIVVRDAARKIEHANVAIGDPDVAALVERLVRQANGHRKARIALLERCGLC